MTAKLRDLLTGQQKETIISSAIEIGDVYKMKLTPEEGIIPKNPGDEDRDKYFIVLGQDKNQAVGFVVINTNIYGKLSQQVKNLHYPIDASKYPFLEKNRYVDCSSLLTIDKNKFTQQFGAPHDKMAKDDLDLIIEAVKTSPTITPKLLKRFNLID